MTEISKLRLGKRMEEKLNSVGILSAEELIYLGSEEAIRRLKQMYPETCVVVYYHIEAAIQDIAIKSLTVMEKEKMKTNFRKL